MMKPFALSTMVLMSVAVSPKKAADEPRPEKPCTKPVEAEKSKTIQDAANALLAAHFRRIQEERMAAHAK